MGGRRARNSEKARLMDGYSSRMSRGLRRFWETSVLKASPVRASRALRVSSFVAALASVRTSYLIFSKSYRFG